MHARAGIIATSLIGLVALTGALAGCSSDANASTANQSKTELVFATPPGTDDPEEQAIMTDLSHMVGEASGRTVTNLQPADYLGVVEAVRNGSVDVAVLSQFSAALAYKTDSVDPLLVWGASSEPASFCLAKKDSGIKTAADLKGHQIAFVDPGSTTGYFMPKSLFKKAGLTDGTDYKSTFAGSHDSAVLAMANGSVDVACTARQLYPTFVQKGVIKEDDVTIIAKSDPIPVGISIVVRKGLDEQAREALKAKLPALMAGNAKLVKTFGLKGEPAKDPEFSTYAPLVDVAQSIGVDLKDLR
ncbi:phosphate/phosphite/phosphonate ABC transporter substrate-binding protein [Arthrobacter sp. CJ23]|uniref:phosphate/phosphite/phosphonate ABC transporter substrate-binding protein n=1 Tax=Arthrobacter sp. CJ23 TaxID=2972479 RepID=UPI00215D45DF|nr:phosphate/phosphite/phosphonate ABC transporter substrate-binding protein [Arthrobacter sp. CJ23]UVJ40552.1 phosphate/phosphite/phosphonate ABC transporter substrate-binding protein [Arthrobacter sp. CJ23]